MKQKKNPRKNDDDVTGTNSLLVNSVNIFLSYVTVISFSFLRAFFFLSIMG